MAAPPAPDLLHASPSSPCAESPDYVPGKDAEGNAVSRADVGAEKVPVPATLAIPLRQGQSGQGPGRGRGPQAGRDPAYAALDGSRLDRLVNPVPCQD